MLRILILEDCPARQAQFKAMLPTGQTPGAMDIHTVETAAECIEKLKAESWDWLFLDHDLGGEVMVESGPGTGYEVACWLEEHPDRAPFKIVVHSLNDAGAKRILAALRPRLTARQMMFAWNWSLDLIACGDPGASSIPIVGAEE